MTPAEYLKHLEGRLQAQEGAIASAAKELQAVASQILKTMDDKSGLRSISTRLSQMSAELSKTAEKAPQSVVEVAEPLKPAPAPSPAKSPTPHPPAKSSSPSHSGKK